MWPRPFRCGPTRLPRPVRLCPSSWSSRPTATGAERSALAADLPQPPIEADVLRAHPGDLAVADRRLVVAHGGGKRSEAPLRDVALADRISLVLPLDHPRRAHPRNLLKLTRSSTPHRRPRPVSGV